MNGAESNSLSDKIGDKISVCTAGRGWNAEWRKCKGASDNDTKCREVFVTIALWIVGVGILDIKT